jgi:hypothetical protein
MTHVLQVSFRQLFPSEALVALAQERYRQLRRARPSLCECVVSLEGRKGGTMAHATVRIRELHQPTTEARASHRDPRVALGLALEGAEARLGLHNLGATENSHSPRLLHAFERAQPALARRCV